MKIHILYPFTDAPFGGANQFLKAIREYFIEINAYEENIENADIILFNSSPDALVSTISNIKYLKYKFKSKIFINRIDGPVSYIRNRNVWIDKAFYAFNSFMCDGTIFQSNWSKEKNYFLGMNKNAFETTILNAPNPKIFYNDNLLDPTQAVKVKIISTSWSSNWKKGFKVYKWLDDNLDFTKYEMTFIGNSPIKFKNIVQKNPMKSESLAAELKQHQIFITASQSDPCSNSLIEAMHSGLVAIGFNDGGHTEIISDGGEVFEKKEEIPILLEKIVKNYNFYRSNNSLLSIEKVGSRYYDFCNNIYTNQVYQVKELTIIKYIIIRIYLTFWKIEEKVYGLKSRLFG